MICTITIAGNPIINLLFLVLCLNKCIPAIPPIPPPKNTNVNNVDSFILHFPHFALFLSIYIAKNVIKFIGYFEIKYTFLI